MDKEIGMDKEWLEKLAPGDYVIVSGGGPLGHDYVKKIERLTKTQIILEGTSYRFRRDSGRQIGGDAWYSTYLIEASKERLADVVYKQKHRALVNKLLDVKWQELELETLKAIFSTLKKNEEKE